MKTALTSILAFCLLFSLTQTAIAQSKPKQVKVVAIIPYDSLRTTLENILETDQGVRKKLSTTPSTERMKIHQEMRRIDSANQIMVKAILAQYGWLPKSKVGEKASDALFFVIQHADTDLRKKYLPELQRLSLIGEARRTHAAMMEDRLLMDQRKKQIYGTQGFSNHLTQGKMLIWPIEDYENVNKRRQEVGFDMTQEEYAKRLGAFYNPTEIIPGLLAE